MVSDLKTCFVEVIRQNQGIVNGLCSLYATSNEEMKDYRQDVLLALWRGFPHFKEESKLSTWMYQVTLNTLITQHRKKKKAVFTEPFSSTSERNHFYETCSDDDILLLQQAIGFLKPINKGVVILHLEGYDNKEIARMLSLSETNVSTKIYRIKRLLKKTVESLLHEPK